MYHVNVYHVNEIINYFVLEKERKIVLLTIFGVYTYGHAHPGMYPSSRRKWVMVMLILVCTILHGENGSFAVRLVDVPT